MAALLLGGDQLDLDDPGVPVLRFDWSGCGPRVAEFRAGDGYNKRRRSVIDSCVWHWTGGEGEPDRVAETLRKRKLGVEFAISRVGAIWQFCDPLEVDTADAGVMNARSVGVEIVCYGYAASWQAPGRVLRVPVVPALGRDRERYVDTVHGKPVETAWFYPAQLRAAATLARTLSAALHIPRVVPREQGGGVLRRAMLPLELRAFAGHLGHYQITAEKRDPGSRLLEYLTEQLT